MSEHNALHSDSLKSEILSACKIAEERLSSASGINIKICLSTNEHLEEAHTKWIPRHFDWLGSSFNDNPHVCIFKLSLIANGELCGVLKTAFEKSEDYHSIVLERVRGNPDKKHPLKGKILDAFCEAALEIAKRLQVPQIDGEDPIDQILNTYKRLGFSVPKNGLSNHITMPVSNATQLNHQAFAL